MYLGLSRPATSQLIDKLVRGGYVRRIESATDRRERNVVLSAKGRVLVERIAVARACRFDASLGVLTPAVASRFQSVLTEVVDILNSAPAPTAKGGTPSAAGRQDREPGDLLLLNLALAFYNVGTIWAHEVDIFRLWKLVGPDAFQQVQRVHWRKLRIGFFYPSDWRWPDRWA